MPWPLLIASYFIVWWLVLFAVLPFGVRTHYDDDTVEGGIAASSPLAPHLALKVLATTVISAAIFGLMHALMTSGVVSLDDVPFFPRFDRIS